MTAQEKITDGDKVKSLTGLALLRAPFQPHQISKLPKPTKRQTDEVKADFRKGIRCSICGGWHHPDVVHLDYVGHAALTDRLLDADPEWNWEPVAFGPDGKPVIDENGGMWIKLTVCGVTRLGYGHPDGKRGGDAIKELIGDALRNAAMRFGAALDLWHKGDLHALDDADSPTGAASKPAPQRQTAPPAHSTPAGIPAPSDQAISSLMRAETLDQLAAIWKGLPRSVQELPEVIGAKDNRKAALQANPPITDDEIPY